LNSYWAKPDARQAPGPALGKWRNIRSRLFHAFIAVAAGAVSWENAVKIVSIAAMSSGLASPLTT
jgi:hypothetical protein